MLSFSDLSLQLSIRCYEEGARPHAAARGLSFLFPAHYREHVILWVWVDN